MTERGVQNGSAPASLAAAGPEDARTSDHCHHDDHHRVFYRCPSSDLCLVFRIPAAGYHGENDRVHGVLGASRGSDPEAVAR